MHNPFHGAIAFIKSHPLGIALGVFAVGAIVVIARRGSAAPVSSDGGYSSAQAAEIQAGTQLQGMQLQAAQQANATAAQLQAAQDNNATSIAIATLQAQTAQNANNQQAAVQENADALSAATTQAVSSLQARVADNQTNAAVTEQQIAATEYTTINAQSTAAQVAIALAPYQSADYIAGLASNDQISHLQGEIDQNAQDISRVNTGLNTVSGVAYGAQNSADALTRNINKNTGLRYTDT